ncbi:hypothetical protein F5877DRAFT_83307 [Lentinula edodes]|nr:hypothetical protein F5877DRAFT_83307 [Lentinula edodes]
MAPPRSLKSPGKRQSKGSSPSSPYKRSSLSKPFVISSHPMLTRTRAQHNVELPLTPPLALLPAITDSTTRILGLVSSHAYGNTESIMDVIENVVSESHKELDQWAQQEISSRDKQIKEEQRLSENNKIVLSQQNNAQIHELKSHYEGKELALTNKLEKCQTQLLVLRRRIQELRSAREIEHRCPICIDLAWNPHVLSCGHMFCVRCISGLKQASIRSLELCRWPICRAGITQKPTPSVTLCQGVQDIADARGVVRPPLYRLRWPVRVYWPARS